MKFVVVLALFFQGLSVPVLACAGTLQKVLEKYGKAKSILTDIKKTDEKPALQTTSVSNGVMKMQKNKIYIVQKGEKKVEFFYLDKILTLVEYPDADFEKNGNRKVTTLKKAIPPLINSLLGLFTDAKNFNKEFSLVSEKSQNGQTRIELKPTQKTLTSLSLLVDDKSNQIKELSFVDDVSTKTTIEFLNTKLNAKLTKADFQFTKLKTDEEMIE